MVYPYAGAFGSLYQIHTHLRVIQQAQMYKFALKIHLHKYKAASAQGYALQQV